MREIHKHDALRALVHDIVRRWNRGRWVQAEATVEHSPLDGSGMVTVNINGDSQAMRYHLPETVDDIADMVHALCESPEEWKSRHRRETGRPA